MRTETSVAIVVVNVESSGVRIVENVGFKRTGSGIGARVSSSVYSAYKIYQLGNERSTAYAYICDRE